MKVSITIRAIIYAIVVVREYMRDIKRIVL